MKVYCSPRKDETFACHKIFLVMPCYHLLSDYWICPVYQSKSRKGLVHRTFKTCEKRENLSMKL